MPSFDIVSQADKQEVANALDQCQRELATRYDFKGTEAELNFKEKENEFEIKANSEERVKAAFEVLQEKFIKRKVSLKFLDAKDPSPAGGKMHRMIVSLKNGLDKEMAKDVVKMIKDNKALKVTPAIQGESVRVTGKKRDDLQDVMAALRSADLKTPVSFENFRD